jgi:predicted RNA-binding Zn-ribbon protein involved in translation (DUF1610 family)
MKKLIRDYKTHTMEYELEYQHGYYCPYCGKQNLWREKGSGDYYQGSAYYCLDCYSMHHLDSSYGDLDADLIKALKEA